MPIPKPRKRETKEKFISRCAEKLAETDPDTPNNVRLGMCYTSWDNTKKKQRRRRNRKKKP